MTHRNGVPPLVEWSTRLGVRERRCPSCRSPLVHDDLAPRVWTCPRCPYRWTYLDRDPSPIDARAWLIYERHLRGFVDPLINAALDQPRPSRALKRALNDLLVRIEHPARVRLNDD